MQELGPGLPRGSRTFEGTRVAALVGTAPPVAQMLGRSYNVEACGDWKREEERRWNWMRGTGGCGTIPMARHWLHTAAASGTSSTGERRDRERSRCHPPADIQTPVQ